MEKLVVTSQDELLESMRNEIKQVLTEYELEKKSNNRQKVYSINRVAKKLGMSHTTVKKLVVNGVLRSTVDGRIPEDALNDYLSSK